jgi:hypothetical protein
VQRVQISDEADGDGTIRDKSFEDCLILGPAALFPIGAGNEFTDCGFDWGQTSAVVSQHQFWGVQAQTDKYVPVFLVDCSFVRCEFDTSVRLEGRDT